MTSFSSATLIAVWMGILYFLPGLLILRALRIRPFFLPAFALSYSLLVLLMLPIQAMGGSACAWGAAVCVVTLAIAALAWFRAPGYCFPRTRRPGAIGAGWLGLMAILLCYLAYAGAYTEVPADVYTHLERVHAQLERLASNAMPPAVMRGPDVLGNFQTRHAYWLHALLCRLSGASVADSVLPVAVFNTLLLGTAFYFLALTVVARLRQARSVKVWTAVLATVLTLMHQGVGVFAYVRYYTLGPAFLNFAMYLAVIAGVMRWLRAERGAGRLLPLLPVIGLATLIVHVQEAMFVCFMVWAMSLAQAGIALAWFLRNDGAWREAGRRAACAAVLCTLVYCMLYAWFHMTRPSSLYTAGCVPLGIGNMLVFDMRGNCLMTMGTWGLVVYALAIFYGRLREMPFLAGGMLIPVLTWLNPLTVDMLLRFTPSSALVFYRAGFLIPIGLMAAIMIVRALHAVFSPHSPVRSRALAALVMACLVVFLFPVGSEGMNGRWTTLRRTRVEHDWRLWRDVVEYVRTHAGGRQVVTDPVTTYMLRPMAGAQVMNRHRGIKVSQKEFELRTVLSELDPQAGCLLVINRRDGAESPTWTISGHWPADVLKVSLWYSPEECAGIVARPDIFRLLWQADRVEIYEVDLRLLRM